METANGTYKRTHPTPNSNFENWGVEKRPKINPQTFQIAAPAPGLAPAPGPAPPPPVVAKHVPVASSLCHSEFNSVLVWQKGMPPVCNADSFHSDWLHPVVPLTTDPWTVALNLCTWNGKACFPADNLRYKYKLKGLKQLVQNNDIVLLQETHFASRSVASVRRLCTSLGCVLFAFARGQAAGGVAAIAKRSFSESTFARAVDRNNREPCWLPSLLRTKWQFTIV